jgi:diguanylate cyclase (GGDEF)-like protein
MRVSSKGQSLNEGVIMTENDAKILLERLLNFMGDLSEVFHEMIVQQEQREKKLREQAEKERRFNTLLVSIMDCLKEWVVVTDESTGEVLYINDLAKKRFYDPSNNTTVCGKDCPLLMRLQSCQGNNQEQRYEFKCSHDQIFQVKAYSLLWEDRKAMVHLITDITYQKENEAFLEVMAYKDELTGLNNRRNCLHTIDSYIEKGDPFSICMIDLDDLKQINDKYGHLSGDAYIKLVSEELKKSASEGDYTCRFGGDEFVVIYKECSEMEALLKLSAIDQSISKETGEYPMSISYGVVNVLNSPEILSETVLKMADEKMYCFKRNRKQKKVQ